MKLNLLIMLLQNLLGLITPELIKKVVDAGLDVIEDAIAKSENKVDDAVLPLISMIRTTLGIPDNDQPK